ncbi:MAG: ribosome rescue protein RqcH [Methanomassiliicoccales archaeon]
MKDEMRAFDLLAVVNEAQSLIGGFVDKVFHWGTGNVLIRVNVKGEGKRQLFFREGDWLYLPPQRPRVPSFPGQFAVHLRKIISNARITGIRQYDFDRVAVVDLNKGEDYQLVIELFGKGNLLLLQEGKILNCLFSRRWKDREIRPGAEYHFPPPRFDPQRSGEEEFADALRSSKSDLVRTLATAANLGGQYAEEVCLRAGMDKSRPAGELEGDEVERLFQTLQDLLDQVGNRPDPQVVTYGEEMVDATPVPLRQNEQLHNQPVGSFSEALDEFLGEQVEEGDQKDQVLQRLERQLERQLESIQQREEEAEDLSRRAEMLYINYLPVSDALHKLSQVSGEPWERIREFASTLDPVEGVDPSRHTATFLLGEERVTLDYLKDLDSNASAIYERSKEIKEKAERAREALKETEDRIEKRKKGLIKEDTGPKVRPTRQFWFERYKWFLTSGGRLVLCGRDARTNDQVVKKHLEQGDRFAHADVHGAPSAVLKDGESAAEEELREACVFALCHSKAWNAGVREGSGYWVLPDQVTKTPQAGEFVPRGAFIIRGKRNYFHHIELEMAVGEVEYEGERKVMCGPREAVECRSGRMVIIRPGKEQRSKVSSRLSHAFQVPEEEVSRILPPGNIDIVESKGME